MILLRLLFVFTDASNWFLICRDDNRYASVQKWVANTQPNASPTPQAHQNNERIDCKLLILLASPSSESLNHFLENAQNADELWAEIANVFRYIGAKSASSVPPSRHPDSGSRRNAGNSGRPCIGESLEPMLDRRKPSFDAIERFRYGQGSAFVSLVRHSQPDNMSSPLKIRT